jgi:sirohydrochlorin ferrochelatase
MSGTAVLLCGHGSRDPDAITEFELAAAALRPRLLQFDFATTATARAAASFSAIDRFRKALIL